MDPKNWPEASTFFFWWSGPESICRDPWLDYVKEDMTCVSHTSVHADGIRIGTLTNERIDEIS